MRETTERGDWINDLLASDPSMWVSGHSSFVERLDIDSANSVEVRFIANRRGVYLYLLTIESALEKWGSLSQEVSQSAALDRFWNELSEFLAGARTVALVYDNSSRNEFMVSSSLPELTRMNSDQLVGAFNRLNSDLVDTSGSSKEINESQNDSFQGWTRQNLSKYLVINDFDAIKMGDEGSLYELKRVKEDIGDWVPYVDDEPNYASLSLIAQLGTVGVRTVAYPQAKSDAIGYHHIETTEKKSYQDCGGSIVGQRLVCSPNRVLDAFPVNQRNEGVERYLSRRFRRWRKCDRGYKIISF